MLLGLVRVVLRGGIVREVWKSGNEGDLFEGVVGFYLRSGVRIRKHWIFCRLSLSLSLSLSLLLGFGIRERNLKVKMMFDWFRNRIIAAGMVAYAHVFN